MPAANEASSDWFVDVVTAVSLLTDVNHRRLSIVRDWLARNAVMSVWYIARSSASPRKKKPSQRYSKNESTGGFMVEVEFCQIPVVMSICVPTRFSNERRSKTAFWAALAALTYFGSPVSLLRSPNSVTHVPISASTLLLMVTSPVCRFTNRQGMPVGDFVKAGISRSARSFACASTAGLFDAW